MNSKQRVIKKISDIKLRKSIEQIIPSEEEFNKLKKIVWGAGVSGKSFIKIYSDLDFEYIVDTREDLQNTQFMKLNICSAEILFKEDPSNTLIFLPTVIHQQLAEQLREKGFYKIVVPNQINISGVGFNINRADAYLLFDWFNDNKINYVYLKLLPENFDKIKDIDILVSSDDIEKLLDCPYLLSLPKDDTLYLDVNWDKPLGINSELPLFPLLINKKIFLNRRKNSKKQIEILRNRVLLLTYIFHIVIHKGCEHSLQKNKKIIEKLQKKCGISFKITLDGLWDYLKETEFMPLSDFVRKWQAFNQSDFLLKKLDELNKIETEYVAYVFRDYLKDKYELINSCINKIKDSGFNLINSTKLNSNQRELVANTIRGGVWEDSYQSKLGGKPFMLTFFINKAGDVRKTKEMIREYINKECDTEVNAIHSSDDALEAYEYMQLVGLEPDE